MLRVSSSTMRHTTTRSFWKPATSWVSDLLGSLTIGESILQLACLPQQKIGALSRFLDSRQTHRKESISSFCLRLERPWVRSMPRSGAADPTRGVPMELRASRTQTSCLEWRKQVLWQSPLTRT